MITFTLFTLAVCAVYTTAEEGTTLPSEEVARRELTDAGYVIRYGDLVYTYPIRDIPIVRPAERNPIETNEIDTTDLKRRPLFYFTTYEGSDRPEESSLPTSRPFIEIRKKREVDNVEIPETSKVGKLRRKRTYCGKCGGGGYGGGYYPVSYAVYPVYYGGGGGKGCNTCGGGGGGGGSYSYSSSSAQSSSGSFGWGKK